jgi:oligosaccharide repeat unit polymerase
MDYHDYLGGALRFNSWLLFIDIFLIIHFFFSWYLSSKKTGWTIDFWHVVLFLSYFLPFLLMYPFATAKLNMLVIGGRNLEFAKKAIDAGFIISLVGFLSIFVGGAIFNHYHTKSPIYGLLIRPFKLTYGKLYRKIVVNRHVNYFVCFFYFLSLFLVLFVAFKGGKLNDPRGYYTHNNQFLFLFNFVNALSGILSGLLTVRIFQFNRRADKFLFFLFIAATLFIGSRGGIISPLIGVFTSFVYFRMKGKIKVGVLLLVVAGLLCLILGLSFVRSGDFSVNVLFNSFFVQIFYGNSFSDLRDFSWVLGLWKGQYLYGKTYLAAFISFIPSSLSSFRTDWSIGKVTATMAGYNPKEHPGLRPGMFGESFLNFGILGVIVLGILIGYSWRYMDYKIKAAAYSGNIVESSIAGIGCVFIGSLSITAGFFGIYVMLVVFIALNFIRLFLITYKKNLA